jgi:hypothetical protein
VLVGAAIGARYWLDTRPLGAVTKAMTVNAVRIDTGHCLATLPPDGAVGAAHVVPCGEPHVAEVIASLPIKGTSWPGSQQVTDQLVAWCEMDSAETALGL